MEIELAFARERTIPSPTHSRSAVHIATPDRAGRLPTTNIVTLRKKSLKGSSLRTEELSRARADLLKAYKHHGS